MNREEIKKVSIVFTTHDKSYSLINMLYSLSRQTTILPFEVCIYDDGSKSDPKPIIDELIPGFSTKYKRSETQLGVFEALPKAFGLVSSESNIIILTCADVIWANENTIDILCESVDNKKLAFANVINTPINVDFWQEFDINLQDILDNWNSYINSYWSIRFREKVFKGNFNLFQGPQRNSWLFYLGAIMKEDIISTGVTKYWCDAILNQELFKRRAKEGWSAVYTDLKAIHQRHNKAPHECSTVSTCAYDCLRKHIGSQN